MTVSWKDKLGQAHKLFEDAKAILVNPNASGEDKMKVQPMLEDAKLLKAEAMQLKEILDQGSFIEGLEEKQKTDPETKHSGKFDNWGQYLYKVWEAGHPNIKKAPDSRLSFFKDDEPKNIEHKDMSEGVGASGGYLVPTEYQPTLQSMIAENSIVRQRATIIPMRRRQLDVPVLDQTGATAGQPHWFGGLRFYWEKEAGQKTESDAAFRQISLVAHKLIGYTRASDELLDDSAVSLAALLEGPMGFAGGAAWMEDYAFLRGTGAGQPLGILNAGATIVEGRAVAGAIGFDDLADMMGDFLPTGRGVWIISQSAMSGLIQLNGPTGNPSYIWQANARDGIPGMILGFPVIWTEKLPLLGNQGDILLADIKYYLVGDRQATTIESTKFDRWQYDQTSWRMVHRVDGQPWLSDPLTLQDGTTQISPFVILGAAVGS